MQSRNDATDYAALLLRLGMGALFLAHGLTKILVFTVPGTVQYFETIGYPGFFAYLVILGEMGGGLALILGFCTRAVALALLPIMVGATLQHLPNGWSFSSPKGGWEFPAFWTLTLAVQALLGGGRFALGTPALARWTRGGSPAARRPAE